MCQSDTHTFRYIYIPTHTEAVSGENSVEGYGGLDDKGGRVLTSPPHAWYAYWGKWCPAPETFTAPLFIIVPNFNLNFCQEQNRKKSIVVH